MKLLFQGLLGLSVFTLSNAHAADCSNYPYNNGMNVEAVGGGGMKIIATATAAVSTDDVDVVNDAREEATLSAKSMIAQFMTDDIKSDEKISKAVNDTKSMQGSDKQIARKETVERLRVMSSSSKHLLRGAVPLGDCYTPGREFRVSVGLKPETLSGAASLERAIGSGAADPAAASVDAQGAASTAQAPNGTLVPQPGYSNSDNVTKF